MKFKSQNAAILHYLKLGKAITPLEALHYLGCFRLAARIHDLRGMGYNIQSEMVDFDDSKVAQYWLEEE